MVHKVTNLVCLNASTHVTASMLYLAQPCSVSCGRDTELVPIKTLATRKHQCQRPAAQEASVDRTNTVDARILHHLEPRNYYNS